MLTQSDDKISQTWNEQRTEALGLALNKMLYPLFEQELVQKLKEEATNHYLQVTFKSADLFSFSLFNKSIYLVYREEMLVWNTYLQLVKWGLNR